MNTPHDVVLLFIKAGQNKVQRPIIKMLILSIFGGFIVGLSACLSSICGYTTIEGVGQFYKGLAFPIGIIIVYCAGGELITGNFLLSVGFFANKIKILDILLSWLIVFIGNFIGCLLIALLIIYSHVPNMFNVNLARIIIITGNEKCGMNVGEIFIKGILANYFHCLGLWIAMIGKEMRSVILGMFIPNFLVMALGLSHFVADIYYILAGLFLSYEYGLDSTEMSWGKLFYKSIIPGFFASLVGGGILVGAIYWYVFVSNDCSKHGRNKNRSKINDNLRKMFSEKKITNENQNQDNSISRMN